MGEKECFWIVKGSARWRLMNFLVFSLYCSTNVYLIYTVLINVLTRNCTDRVFA